MNQARPITPVAMGAWRIPLLGLPGMTVMPSDEETLGNMIRPFFMARTLERRTESGEFRSVASGLQVGQLAVMATQSSALESEGEVCHGLNLVLPFRHPGFWRVEGREFRVAEQPFLLPQCPYTHWAEQSEGVMLSLDPARLVAVAMAMSGHDSDQLRQRVEAALQRPQLIDLDQGHSRQHLSALHQTLWLLDQTMRNGDGISPLLALDDLLTRLVLLLVLPELDGGDQQGYTKPLLTAAGQGAGRGAERAIDELVDWILADLQRPFSLTDLETRSGYARRTLQKRFQQRFGMGPMQWVRRQRLQQARQMIETSEGTLKLGAIAQACGYHNPASFSRDFHEVFGLRASEWMRQTLKLTR